MIERPQFVERRHGHATDFVSHYELNPDDLGKLNSHRGKSVQVWVNEERWINEGPGEEDYASEEVRIFGTLIEAGIKSVVIDINAGVVKYDTGVTGIVAGRREYPYYRRQYQEGRYAETVRIDRLDVANQTFQWGEASGQEQLEQSA